MTAKEFMNRAFKIKTRIKLKKEQLEEFRALAARTTANYGSEQVAHSRNTSSMEDSVIRIIEHEKKLERELDDLVAIQDEVQEVIDLVADERYRILLQARYVNGLSWNKVAADCMLSKRHAERLEIPALKMVETVLRTKEASRHA